MKKVIYGEEARKGLKQGLDMLTDAVQSTLGGKGLPVAIDRPYTTPHITKDGVSVAKELMVNDPLLNMGINMGKSVAEAADVLGDGSTTPTVLCRAFVHEGMKYGNSKDLIKGIDFAHEQVQEMLKQGSIQIKDDFDKMVAIPTISANNDRELGEMIAKVFRKTGEYGFIHVEESKSDKTFFEVTSGLKFKMAPESMYMFQDTIKKTSSLKNCLSLLYIGRIETDQEILPAIEISTKEKKPLIVVCQEISPMLLQRIVAARLNGSVNVTVMQCPEFGILRTRAMEDIALVAGAKLFLQEKDDDISKVTKEDLGLIEKVDITEEETSFINPSTQDKVKEMVDYLLDCPEKDEQDVKERVARLTGGVARIYVGGHSEMEMREKKDRVVDAVNALTAAYKNGVIIGGGVALLRAAQKLKTDPSKSRDFNNGIRTVKQAIQYPVKQILKNSGHKEPNLLQRILGKKTLTQQILSSKIPNAGYDVIREELTDMLEAGILDPLIVAQTGLSKAVSVAKIFLTTECIMIDITNQYPQKEIKFADGI